MIQGFATAEGTSDFATRSTAHKDNFRKIHELTLSNIGIGTYLGNPDLETDRQQKNAIKQSILQGINVIDTAINYRAQKSERTVGKAISELIEDEKITRDQVFVSTKNGYVTNDADVPEDFMQYIMKEFGKKGIVKEGDISAQYNCITTPFLEDQLARSKKNLGLECIDLMYLHNSVEGQLQMPRDKFITQLKNVFEFFEKHRKEGNIRFYGLATWECFRVPKDNPNFLSLAQVMDLAREAGGDTHGFRFVQLPYNFSFDQAFMQKNQPLDSNNVTFLEAAIHHDIGVFTSVPLMQGKLLQWISSKPELTNQSPSVNALQFVRSTPGVLAPLIGQKLDSHVEENLEALKIPPYSEQEFATLFKKLVS